MLRECKEIREIRVCGKCGKEVFKRKSNNFRTPQNCPFCRGRGSIITKYVVRGHIDKIL